MYIIDSFVNCHELKWVLISKLCSTGMLSDPVNDRGVVCELILGLGDLPSLAQPQ